MKLTTYNTNVQKAVAPNVQVQNVGSLSSYGGGNQQGYNQLAKGIMDVEGAIKTKIDMDNNVAIANAQTDYLAKINHLLYDEDTGLAHTELKGASGVSERFMEEEAKIRQEVLNKLPSYMQTRINFDDFAEKSYIQNQKMMDNHEFQQSQKYTDVTYENLTNKSMDSAILGYQNIGLVKQVIGNIKATTVNLYGNRGEEFINSVMQKNVDNIGLKVLNTAIEKNDFTTIDAIIPALRESGVSEDILSKAEAKSFDVNTKFDLETNIGNDVDTFQSKDEGRANYLAKHGGVGGAIDQGELEAAMKPYLGMPYQLGADGTTHMDCGLFTQTVLKSVGINLNARTADAQALQMEKEGKISKDTNNIQYGDLVFMNVPANDKRWPPDNNPDAVHSDDKAYKGITHVGIYVGNGQVMQSGSSGVKTIPIDTYKVVEIGKTGGGKQLTAGQKYELSKRYDAAWDAEVAKREAARKKALRNQAEAIQQQVVMMQLNNATPQEIYQFTSGAIQSNPELATTGLGGMVVSMKHSIERAAIDSIKAKNGHVNMILEAIGEGQSKEQIENIIKNSGLSFSTEQLTKIWKSYDDKSNGRGAYSVDMTNIKEDLINSGIDKKDVNAVWSGVYPAIQNDIIEYQQKHNGQQPNHFELLDMAKKAVSKQTLVLTEKHWYDFGGDNYQFEFSPAELRQKGIEKVKYVLANNGDPYVRVFFVNGKSDDIEPATFRNMINGK